MHAQRRLTSAAPRRYAPKAHHSGDQEVKIGIVFNATGGWHRNSERQDALSHMFKTLASGRRRNA
jgi:hypothetical protein